MDETPWPPALRYRFYRAWNTMLFGIAGVSFGQAVQFNETLALLFFFGGLAVMLYGAIMSQRALREANRSTRWRNYMPRLEDLPPIAVRRLDPEAVDLRRWADAAVGTVVASVVLGWLAETLLT